MFSSAFGGVKQMHEWTVSHFDRSMQRAIMNDVLAPPSSPQNFISADEFCIRACKDGPKATEYCEHIYDVMGCYWNMPGDYSAGSFDSCKGDSGDVRSLFTFDCLV